MELHPNLAPIAALEGTWRGAGHGIYPTIKDFDYTEQLTFTNVGKPFFSYVQHTWSPDGAPMHTETGYVRVSHGNDADDDERNHLTLELILALPTGQTELAEGTLNMTDHGFAVTTEAQVSNSGSAKQVDHLVRRYELHGDRLLTSLDMAAVGVDLNRHLTSELVRVGQTSA